MNKMNEKKLQKIFSDIFQNSADVTKLRMAVSAEWDSLSATELALSIETEFNIKLNNEDMERISSYDAVQRLLEEKGF